MFNGYHLINRYHAARAIAAVPDISGIRIGIGDSEKLASIPIDFKPQATAQSAEIPKIKTMDDTLYLGKGAQVSPKDFPANWYMGE